MATLSTIETSANMPNSGTWTAGTTVLSTDPIVYGSTGARYIIFGWKRITNGSNHVLNVDWFQMRDLTGD